MEVDIKTTAGKLADLGMRMDEAVHASGAQAVVKQHARGKMTARERIHALLDEGTFSEMDEFARHRSTAFGLESRRPYGDGVIIGVGAIHGRPVCVFSQDVGIFGGSLGEVYGTKIAKIIDFATTTGCPLIGINEGGGARIQEGVGSLGAYGDIFLRNVHASGVIPQISLIMGAAAGGHVYSPALTDFVVMVDQTSQMFITGPEVIRTVTGEDVSMEELGGGRTHNTKSGNAHYLAADEADALEYVRELITYLPQNNLEDAPVYEFAETADLDFTDHDRKLDTLIPDNPSHAYDMRDVIRTVVDEDEFLEIMALYAPNIICGFARIEGRSIGIVANQPLVLAGCLDTKASEKAARFVRTCDAFNVPVLTFVDVPGFLPASSRVRRHHPAGRQVDLRLRRGHRPADDRHHPQGLRWCLHRDGLQAPGRRRQPGLADRTDRGDGRRGCGEDPLPQRARVGRRPGRRQRRVAGPIQPGTGEPLPGS